MLSNKRHHKRKTAGGFVGWNITGYFIIGIVFASLIASWYFIYRYLYQTLDEANSVVVLRSSPDIDIIDMAEYEKVQSLLAIKNSTSSTVFTRNMFVVLSTSTPENTTSTP